MQSLADRYGSGVSSEELYKYLEEEFELHWLVWTL